MAHRLHWVHSTAFDKAKVESAVLVTQRWILAGLRDETFFSLGALNRRIWELLEALNGRRMQKVGMSRRELFEQLERPALRPLPLAAYELAEWYPDRRVNIDYHVEVDRNYYSVPFQLLGERVDARMTATVVEIYFKDRRVTSHERLFGRGKYSTKLEHMPRAHRAHAEWTPSRLIRWAEKTGPATGGLVAEILRTKPHPEQGYRACLGIMRLGKAHGADRLESACARAGHLGAASYRSVKNILSSGMDRVPLDDEDPSTPAAATPAHENIRGAAYYARSQEDEPC